jgi:hypothetical protein
MKLDVKMVEANTSEQAITIARDMAEQSGYHVLDAQAVGGLNGMWQVEITVEGEPAA